MAFPYRFIKGFLSVVAGVAILGVVFSPFIDTAPSGTTLTSTQEKSSPAYVEIFYAKCGHTEISYDTSLIGASSNSRIVIENYCPHHYLVKAENGKLNVYRLSDLNGAPIKSEDININKLPQSDRISLENGIEVHSDERLDALLDDYLS